MKYDTDPCKETSDADSYAGYARNTWQFLKWNNILR
jgi:hypothetical protein